MAEYQAACDYLAGPVETFWEWRDAGESIAWWNGQTITFRSELLAVLERQAPRGLPPLSAVLLLLGATRRSWNVHDRPLLGQWLTWNGAVVSLRQLIEELLTTGRPELRARYQLIHKVLEQLDQVSRLPPSLRTTAGRAELVAMALEHCTIRTTPALAEAVVQVLRAGLPEVLVAPRDLSKTWPQYGFHGLLRDFTMLRVGLEDFMPALLEMRLRTGVEQIPEPAELALPTAERIRDLLTRLEDDEELHGVARLANNLMAAMSIPRSVSDHDELPLGGVSDISNRGTLDRLLLSELAQDDLTLAVRIAMNEALYLRRERPPRHPPRQRVVLLEAGLRSWGVPRLFATAVALALAATTDRQTELLALRACGEHLIPVDLTRREGILAHLEELTPEVHPGPALPHLQQHLRQMPLPSELIVVTTDDVLADRAFTQALASSELLPVHLGSVSRNGEFHLSVRTRQGTKLLRSARLDLDAIMNAPRRRLLEPIPSGDLPAILSVVPFPLLVPHQIDTRQLWWVYELGLVTATSDRRLTVWTEHGKGPRQLSDRLPSGMIHWCAPEMTHRHRLCLVLGPQQATTLMRVLVDIRTGDIEERPLPLRRPLRAVWAQRGALFVLTSAREVQLFDLLSGEPTASRGLPNTLTWSGTRFFRESTTNEWFTLHHDGQKVEILPVATGNAQLLALFDSVHKEGVVGITHTGDLYFTATNSYKPLFSSRVEVLGVDAISHRGDRVALRVRWRGQEHRQRFVADIENGTLRYWYTDPLAEVERLSEVVQLRTLRVHFTGIAAGRNSTLILISRKGRKLRLRLQGDGTILLEQAGDASHQDPLPFRALSSPLPRGYSLSVATWSEGSRAFLDSRGLLHLKSANRQIPELTLVLNDSSAISGWCADGRLWGATYFTGCPVDKRTTLSVGTHVLQAFVEHLP